ncbi:nucleoside diphosphate-linked moiety X motif 19-like isoform X2 [Dendronephthya gigantea]|uniref:nucleoside diphosphate-linked moiety X motif 19-like isoform X2 n=1 Tax=Dendronephthya gigantea TaxID=151771 RepID=UPI00106D1819|nr:nucleoside diphosphate-linked moiety X motif 19-like isoform X2 [Dendronephthya gigantea]
MFPVIPRPSTTLMLVVRNQLTNHQQSVPPVCYKLLMLQRSSNMKFMPNRYVFPGGVSEITDFSSEWMDLIGSKELQLRPTMTSAPFYETYSKQLTKDSLPAHVGFRICAIRETFEESGVLLVRSLRDQDEGGRSAGLVRKMLSDDEIKSWRGKIHSNSSLFIELCRHIQCVPDIWSLYEWSNWTTPAGNIARRFNTMFYLAFLNNEPEMSHDGTEVVCSTWVTPSDAVDYRLSNMLQIAPPQFYEMSRLCSLSFLEMTCMRK